MRLYLEVNFEIENVAEKIPQDSIAHLLDEHLHYYEAGRSTFTVEQLEMALKELLHVAAVNVIANDSAAEKLQIRMGDVRTIYAPPIRNVFE